MLSGIPNLSLQFRFRWSNAQQRAPYVLFLALFVSLSGLSVDVSAQTDGACPGSGVIQGMDGNYYGVSFKGGSDDYGAVYRYVVMPMRI